MNPYYKDYSEYLAERFGGMKVQKISVDAGFSCPNRDGTIARGGCIYCDNRSFTPRYCRAEDGVTEQLRKGKEFFIRKYPRMKYLAYFQSFTGTHAHAVEELRALYAEAAAQEDIVGLIIGTRPDCLPEGVLDMLEELNKELPVIVELGAETSHDSTLKLINRGHTWHDVETAAEALHSRGIETGLHLIAGLPGEEKQDVMLTIERSLQFPISSIKLHQLQIIVGTPLHRMWQRGEIEVKTFTLEEYLDLCVEVVRKVGKRVCIERFLSSAPPEMVVAPHWGLKNYQFTHLLLKELGNEG